MCTSFVLCKDAWLPWTDTALLYLKHVVRAQFTPHPQLCASKKLSFGKGRVFILVIHVS